MLLGEKLIAFRDQAGRVGVMDHRCPHRCASLFYGRNEPGGMRCVYHGWQFDADGNCIDMPNLTPEQDFRQKVWAVGFAIAEIGMAVSPVVMGAHASVRATWPLTTCVRHCLLQTSSDERHQRGPYGDQTKRRPLDIGKAA